MIPKLTCRIYLQLEGFLLLGRFLEPSYVIILRDLSNEKNLL